MPGQPFDQPSFFSSAVQPLGPDVVVTVAGELDVASAPATMTVLAEAASIACRRVIIDASAVTFIDAAGLRTLCIRPLPPGAGVPVVLRAPSQPVTRLLKLADLCGLVETDGSWPGREELGVTNATTVGTTMEAR